MGFFLFPIYENYLPRLRGHLDRLLTPESDQTFMRNARALETILGDPVYVAILRQDGTQMLVNQAFKARMLYASEKLLVEEIIAPGPRNPTSITDPSR